jgi:hypothetical protein
LYSSNKKLNPETKNTSEIMKWKTSLRERNSNSTVRAKYIKWNKKSYWTPKNKLSSRFSMKLSSKPSIMFLKPTVRGLSKFKMP